MKVACDFSDKESDIMIKKNYLDLPNKFVNYLDCNW